MHCRVKYDFAGGGQEQGGEQRRIGRPDGNRCHPDEKQRHTKYHGRLAPVAVACRPQQRASRAKTGTKRNGVGERVFIYADAGGDERQEGIDHAEGCIDDNPRE